MSDGLMFRVHIVAKRANQYIVAFRVAISYDINLSGGGGQAMQMVDVRSADASICRHRSAEFLESTDNVDNIPYVFLSRILFLKTAKRH